eukprot:CAMPEP_0204368736 /NCGR_PEP_ID=MMETSP0469-20131031/44410_1 /ASSEMBLY_ACC=CAM_ASM_000384 /TAXON_ID=2969 /ORGANISM="Oxyrrhis marina" /LENGTH=541 /DNA_ID=CAMNT_0051358345 /DNA_START=14 /DNA_END=1639 /DNA_ORIENTATION=+
MRGCVLLSWALLPSVHAFSVGSHVSSANASGVSCSIPPWTPVESSQFAAEHGSFRVALLDGDLPVCEYHHGKNYTVAIFSSVAKVFEGFVLHRTAGTYTVPEGARQHDIDECVTHSSNLPKTIVRVPWTPPADGEVVFTATVVQDSSTVFGQGAVATTVVASGSTVDSECQMALQSAAEVRRAAAADEVDTSAFNCTMEVGDGVLLYAHELDNDRIRLGISAPVGGWVSFGTATGNSMEGGDVVIGGSSKTGDASHVGAYELTSTKSRGIIWRDDAKAMTNPEVIKTGGRTYLFFERDLVTDHSTLSMSGNQLMMWGIADREGDLKEHSDYGVVDIDFGACTVDSAVASKKQVHGALMWISWGFLMPIGAVAAASGGDRFKKRGPVWGPRLFKAHRALQSLGFVLALIGVIYGMAELAGGHLEPHGAMGLLIMIIAAGLMLSGILKPKPEPRTMARVAFEIFHKKMGPAVAFMGVFNCVAGGYLAQDQESSLNAFSSFLIPSAVTTVLFAVAFLFGKCTGAPPAATTEAVNVQANMVGKEA